MASDQKRKSTNKNQPVSQFSDSDSAVWREYAAKAKETEDETDDLLDSQLANQSKIDDLERAWTEDKEKLLEKKWKKKYRVDMLHEAKLSLAEENRQNQLANEAMMKAKLYEEYTPKIEEETRKRITVEAYTRLQEALEPKLRKMIEREVQAAHQEGIDALKASHEKKFQISQVQYAQKLEEVKAKLLAANGQLRKRLEVYEPVIDDLGNGGEGEENSGGDGDLED